MPEILNIELKKVLKRLELIKILVSLEEVDELNVHISKLEEQILSSDIETIVDYLKKKSYNEALKLIEVFINMHNNLIVFNDPEINNLKLEIKTLEAEVSHLLDKKADLEKLIYEFGIRHSKELGEILVKILQCRQEKSKGTSQQKETEEDYNNYKKEFDTSKFKEFATISIDDQTELKDKYRKASKLCHPDLINEEQKEFATKLFTELSNAYQKNDLIKVREILENLEKGNNFVSKSDAMTKNALLKLEINKLRSRIIELKEEIHSIMESETYKTISTIDDWDKYFGDTKMKLKLQLNDLESGK